MTAITAVIEDNYRKFWPTWRALKEEAGAHMFKSFGVSYNFYPGSIYSFGVSYNV